MRTLLRLIGGLIALLVVGLLVLVVVARFSDGPLAIIAGGPFTSGRLVTTPVGDWSFLHDTQEVQFQLENPARSRTTWIVEHNGRIYIPSGYMNSWWGKLWKQWPHEAEMDGRILLRVGDDLYERKLVRVDAGPDLGGITKELGRKYGGALGAIPVEAVTSGSLWIFEVAPRSEPSR